MSKPMNDNDADDKGGKNWIKGAVKHPGALHRDLGVPQGEKIPMSKIKAAAKKGGKIGARARLAETFHHMDAKRTKGNAADEKTHRMLKAAAIEQAGE